jgi:histidinol-phosphatase (PHP family)
MCRAAFEKGLCAIGFSSHAPTAKAGLDTFWNMKDERMEAYAAEVHAARQRWEGKIAVYFGLEVDYIKGMRSALDNDIRHCGTDYLIGSIHYLLSPHGVPFTIDGTAEELETGIREGFGGDGEAMIHAYWDAVMEMIALGGIDIVGHLDLVKKHNAQGHWFNMESSSYIQRVEEAARAIAAAGLVLEVNTGGMNRGYLAETCPSPAILRLLRQYAIPIMISADAHNANDIDGHYPQALQTLLDAGYTSHVIFAGKDNGKPVWTEAAIGSK